MHQAEYADSIRAPRSSSGNSTEVSARRRALMFCAALLPLAAIAAPGLSAARDPALSAWSAWKAVRDACPGDALGDDAEDRWNDAYDAAMAKLVATTATTPAGLAAKLRAAEEVHGSHHAERLTAQVIAQLEKMS